MYLKSIEMHGFKSFANKIVLEFHNGITGIVGPNGSGKSNVADAVRWVLGEQSAKQLRGASMQDVIFSGTENRKSLSYAYVAITLDNADHILPIDFEEVTIARRVYRSGESEYLLNGTACRLKDVHELFYDTGIGKEGYSIIGQGQIERILSGKPEERRELFDEAVGIVKYKKRKLAAQKKLAEERDNLVRVNDILNELERQVGPLLEQSKAARRYLALRDEMKKLDVNMFLIEVDRINGELARLKENGENASKELAEAQKKGEEIKEEYAALEEQIAAVNERIDSLREEEQNTTLTKGKLENEISLLEEQIRSAESNRDNFENRRDELQGDLDKSRAEQDRFAAEKDELKKMLDEAVSSLEKAKNYYDEIKNEINRCNTAIEDNNAKILKLLDDKANVKSEDSHLHTLIDQTNIRKAALNKRLLEQKTKEEALTAQVEASKKEYDAATERLEELKTHREDIRQKIAKRNDALVKARRTLSDKQDAYHKAQSRLEALKNIAERYDGYGNSIRKVMEQKTSHKGLIGVVADLIHVERKYETAIETALGGNIQNIVTEDENTAKEMISYLKKNHFGRATFLPLTAVDGRGNFKKREVLSESGVIGMADELLDFDARYAGVMAYLLGRVVVCEQIDDALALAKKYKYSLHIVTLEGEYLSPGGSLSGGAFKNRGNLLARNREIEDMEAQSRKLSEEVKKEQAHIEEMETAVALLEDDEKQSAEKVGQAALAQNTAKISYDAAMKERESGEETYRTLSEENEQIEKEILDIDAGKEENRKKLDELNASEEQLHEDIEQLQKELDQQTYMETSAARNVSEIEMEEMNARAKVTFAEENLSRVTADVSRYQEAIDKLLKDAAHSEEEIEEKKSNISAIRETIASADENYARLQASLKEAQENKQTMDSEYKGFFEKREAVSDAISRLEKEILRLDTQREKAEDALNYQNNYMWDEYELTLHAAMELKDEAYADPTKMKRELSSVKEEIRGLGSVNVNAIEEYQEVSERYETMKTQHDDIIEAEERLVGIIDELDIGMRKQFEAGFADIRREFDKAFKELFGGGKGTLELIEGEDILESGIKIIAQPPGKKLQNMMQLSGGEKSLTAISLLFAIQNLKPSPFCLLDEIEAALDDSNVGRFADYLHKLTKNTQFIIITHRRGTMNAADRLYGITMQEKGISTLVSVNLIEADLDA